MHPRYKVPKRYLVKVDHEPDQRSLARLRRGVELSDGVTQPAGVEVLRLARGKAWVELVISEGRNQQVRRMFEAVGLRLEKLRRTAVGPLQLGRLPAGAMRRLSAEEVWLLREAVGLQN